MGRAQPADRADGGWIDLMGDGGAAGCGAEGVCATGPGEEAEENRRARGGPIRPHAFKPSLAVRRRVLEEACGEVMRAFFKSRREANKVSREDARAKESGCGE